MTMSDEELLHGGQGRDGNSIECNGVGCAIATIILTLCIILSLVGCAGRTIASGQIVEQKIIGR